MTITYEQKYAPFYREEQRKEKEKGKGKDGTRGRREKN